MLWAAAVEPGTERRVCMTMRLAAAQPGQCRRPGFSALRVRSLAGEAIEKLAIEERSLRRHVIEDTALGQPVQRHPRVVAAQAAAAKKIHGLAADPALREAGPW